MTEEQQPKRMGPVVAVQGPYVIVAVDDQPVEEGKQYAADLTVRVAHTLREFPYPSYRIWTLLAHWTEGLDEVIESEQASVTQVLAEHRRLRNVRSCSGCDWVATAPGRNGEPGTMQARHEQFNAHLSALIIDTLTRPAS